MRRLVPAKVFSSFVRKVSAVKSSYICHSATHVRPSIIIRDLSRAFRYMSTAADISTEILNLKQSLNSIVSEEIEILYPGMIDTLLGLVDNNFHSYLPLFEPSNKNYDGLYFRRAPSLSSLDPERFDLYTKSGSNVTVVNGYEKLSSLQVKFTMVEVLCNAILKLSSGAPYGKSTLHNHFLLVNILFSSISSEADSWLFIDESSGISTEAYFTICVPEELLDNILNHYHISQN